MVGESSATSAPPAYVRTRQHGETIGGAANPGRDIVWRRASAARGSGSRTTARAWASRPSSSPRPRPLPAPIRTTAVVPAGRWSPSHVSSPAVVAVIVEFRSQTRAFASCSPCGFASLPCRLADTGTDVRPPASPYLAVTCGRQGSRGSRTGCKANPCPPCQGQGAPGSGPIPESVGTCREGRARRASAHRGRRRAWRSTSGVCRDADFRRAGRDHRAPLPAGISGTAATSSCCGSRPSSSSSAAPRSAS